jgi:hypothetical protein
VFQDILGILKKGMAQKQKVTFTHNHRPVKYDVNVLVSAFGALSVRHWMIAYYFCLVILLSRQHIQI